MVEGHIHSRNTIREDGMSLSLEIETSLASPACFHCTCFPAWKRLEKSCDTQKLCYPLLWFSTLAEHSIFQMCVNSAI